MSIRLVYRVVTPDEGISLSAGTSTDWVVLKENFPSFEGGVKLRPGDVRELRLMHAAAVRGRSEGVSVWGLLADLLERLETAEIKVWGVW